MDKHENPTGLIRERRLEIKREIERLKAEDAGLEAVERSVEQAVARLLGRHAEPPKPNETHYHMKAEPGHFTIRTVAKPKTTKEIIIDYLTRTPSLWRTANDIQQHVSEVKGASVPMGSISPTLTELKNAEIIVRDNLRVALAERVRRETPDFFKDNEPPKGDPEDGSETSVFA